MQLMNENPLTAGEAARAWWSSAPVVEARKSVTIDSDTPLLDLLEKVLETTDELAERRLGMAVTPEMVDALTGLAGHDHHAKRRNGIGDHHVIFRWLMVLMDNGVHPDVVAKMFPDIDSGVFQSCALNWNPNVAVFLTRVRSGIYGRKAWKELGLKDRTVARILLRNGFDPAMRLDSWGKS
jgi:hypothetical protein